MLTILNALKNNIQAEGCYPYVGPITLLNSNSNDYPLIWVQFEDASWDGEAVLDYRFSIYYMEVVTPEVSPEEVQDRGIKTLARVLDDFEFSNAVFTPFIQEFSDVCSGVVLDVTIYNSTNKC